MKKLAFIDHSFHTKSTATFFLIELLQKYFSVEIIWDRSWEKGQAININEIADKHFDTIIIFQRLGLFKSRELERLNCRNIIMVPMFDELYAKGRIPSDLYLLQYGKHKFISFSNTLNRRFERLGIDSQYFQYFCEPSVARPSENHEGLKGFFWQRRSEITWKQIRILIANSEFDCFHIHCATDPPGHELVRPSAEDEKRYHISFSKWFPEKAAYFQAVCDSDVYFTPRAIEGIGMSFIEAMAMGKCVVAPNSPTMNEYITHGVTGLLYDPQNPAPLDFSNARRIGYNARRSVEQGYLRWKQDEKRLIDFIARPPSSSIMKNLKVYFAMSLLPFKPVVHSILSDLKKRLSD